MKFIDLDENQTHIIDESLEEYDENYITYHLEGAISIGIEENGEIVAGVNGCMTAFKIFYISTLFVKEKYRRKGYGRLLIQEVEKRAKQLGANTIRLDTFNWQGKDFYLAMGYQKVGFYRNDQEDYEEYFFLKRI